MMKKLMLLAITVLHTPPGQECERGKEKDGERNMERYREKEKEKEGREKGERYRERRMAGSKEVPERHPDGRLASRLSDRRVGWLLVCFASGWLVGQGLGWLAGCLHDCMAPHVPFVSFIR